MGLFCFLMLKLEMMTFSKFRVARFTSKSGHFEIIQNGHPILQNFGGILGVSRFILARFVKSCNLIGQLSYFSDLKREGVTISKMTTFTKKDPKFGENRHIDQFDQADLFGATKQEIFRFEQRSKWSPQPIFQKQDALCSLVLLIQILKGKSETDSESHLALSSINCQLNHLLFVAIMLTYPLTCMPYQFTLNPERLFARNLQI